MATGKSFFLWEVVLLSFMLFLASAMGLRQLQESYKPHATAEDATWGGNYNARPPAVQL
ncbi:hypothetical protein MANES_06G134100v8 [Manihot esculenta]|uniref:Uncharacterized protein n=1 Tax=Manihot esculenta TaxID=3983 RepID=A0A2C9VQN7_MANES|nr:hypothetical protein MANES_06G134100v8 [Manihot esculenta]